MKELQHWLEELINSLDHETFVKLTLSKPAPGNDLLNVYAKQVTLKGKSMLSFTYHYATKDIVKNLTLEEAVQKTRSYLADRFKIGTLLTTKGDFTLRISKKGKMDITRTYASHDTAPPTTHDNAKQKRAEHRDSYLKQLGVTDSKGKVIPKMADKYRQINKYLEVMEAQLKAVDLSKPLTIVDMGSGKGYLTFALYDYLKNKLLLEVEITGIEQRKDLVDWCNTVAKSCGFDHLHFELSTIQDYTLTQVDVLIALHACDTATDDAISKGISANASLIVCAPCCHKQIRQQLKGKTQESPILNYGIFKEREYEMVTDTIRALLLEKRGYKANVFEFISNEHTRKNIMLVGARAQATGNVAETEAKIDSIKAAYHIDFHYLEKQLED